MFVKVELSDVTPEAIGLVAAVGVSPQVPRADHIHDLTDAVMTGFLAANDLTFTDHEIDFAMDYAPPANAPKIIGAENVDTDYDDFQTFKMLSDGSIYMGTGAAPLDTSIIRSDVGTIQITNYLDVKGINLEPSGTGTQEIISITPSEALVASANWRGVSVDGSALNPDGTGVEIDAFYADLSDVDLSNDPLLHGIHIIMPDVFTGVSDKCAAEFISGSIKVDIVENPGHALLISGPGDINMTYDASGITGDDIFCAHCIILDGNNEDAGMIHGVQVNAVNPGTTIMAAISAYPNIDPVHHHIRDDVAELGKAWSVNGGWVDRTVAFGDPGTDITLFNIDGYVVYMGALAKFDEIIIDLATASSKNIYATFEFWDGEIWVAFLPSDNTHGFTNSGSIFFNSDSLTNWSLTTVNGEGDGPWYYIRITRTRPGTIVTPSVENTIGVESLQLYQWDKTGAIYCGNLHPDLKSGINQEAAGAVVGEQWQDTSDGNTIKMGV